MPFLNRTHFAFTLILLAYPIASAQAPPEQKVCALLAQDDAQAPGLLQLIELKVGQLPAVSLVERQDVEKLLREQQLTAALGAESVRDRIALGRILRADVLVLLRVRQEPVTGIEVLVAETSQGLRLLHRLVPLDRGLEAAADAVTKLVAGGLAKAREKDRQVYAVPPFISKDLTRESDHLKAALTGVLEQQLLEQPAALVVEFVEARALAAELALSEGDQKVQRNLPLYVLGEYRHEGQGDQRRIALTLELKRGETSVALQKLHAIPPAQAPQALRDAIAVLAKHGGAQIVKTDAAREKEGLAQRQADFERLGHWPEALDVIEASLLLDPDQPQLRRAAMRMVPNLRENDRGSDPAVAARRSAALHHARRALDHFDVLRRTGQIAPAEAPRVLFDLRHRLPGNSSYHQFPTTDEDVVAFEVDAERFIGNIVRERLRSGEADAGDYAQILGRSPAAMAERVAIINDLKGPAIEALRAGMFGKPTRGTVQVEYQNFLKLLAESPDPSVRAAAAEMHTKMREAARQPAVARDGGNWLPPPRPAGELVELRPLTLNFIDPSGTPIKPPHELDGWCPAGPQVDVAWSGFEIFIMKRPGELRRVYSSGERSGRPVRHVVFDGRYLWATVDNSGLVIIDPVAETATPITAADQVPSVRLNARVAPLGVGRACLVGNLSHTWIGLATLDLPKAQCTVDVIHQAMERDVADDKRWQNTSTTFHPTYVHTLSGRIGQKVEQRVLIGRSSAGAAKRYPLLVDPGARSVEVLPDEVTFHQSASRFTVHEGAMYWSDLNPDTPRLFRIGFPTLRRETLMANCPDGPVVFHQGRMIVAPFDNLREYQITRRRARGWPMQWWIADAPGEALRPLWPTIEDSRPVSRVTVSETQHLGLIAQALISGSFAHFQTVFTGKPVPHQPAPPADGITKSP